MCRIYRRWLIKHLDTERQRIRRMRCRIKIAYDIYRYAEKIREDRL